MTQLVEFDLSDFQPNPKILLDAGPPRALYKVNPRLIFGQVWWNEVRRWAYEKSKHRCKACGKNYTKLEAHELYKIDKRKGIISIKDVVAVCFDCHSFIHQDLHRALLKSGRLKSSDVLRILNHGKAVLKRAKIKNVRVDPNCPNIKFEDWRLELNGVLYKPVFEEN